MLVSFALRPLKQLLFTDPVINIGQWAPIVGTGLAIVGSLYLLIAADMEAEDEADPPTPQPTTNTTTIQRCPRCETCAISDDDSSNSSTRSRHSSRSRGEQASTEISRTATHPSVTRPVNRSDTIQTDATNQTLDARGRRKVARVLNTASKELTRKLHQHIEQTGFNTRGLTEYPQVPGERLRNRNLPDVQKAYSSTPLTRSRAQSFIGSIHSDAPNGNGEGSSRTPQGSSRHLSLPTPVSPVPRAVTRQRHANTFSSGSNSVESRGRPTLTVLGDLTPGRSRSPSRGSVSNEERGSRTPSIPEVSPSDMTFDGDGGETGTSPKIILSTP